VSTAAQQLITNHIKRGGVDQQDLLMKAFGYYQSILSVISVDLKDKAGALHAFANVKFCGEDITQNLRRLSIQDSDMDAAVQFTVMMALDHQRINTSMAVVIDDFARAEQAKNAVVAKYGSDIVFMTNQIAQNHNYSR
jgi:hypothetical protein